MSNEQESDGHLGTERAPRQVQVGIAGQDPWADPDEAEVGCGQTLFWKAVDDDRHWVVIFKGNRSPFQSGKLLFWGKGKGVQVGGPIRTDLDVGAEFPYNLIYQDGQGVPQVKDPIVVISDVM